MAFLPALEVLGQFYIFKPELGAKDGEEHKKLLFYYPKTDSLDAQIQNVGFCEAVVKFSENFTGGEAPFHEVNTDKEFHVYCNFEESFLVGAAFVKAAAAERKYFLNGKALKNVVSRAYETFRLFFGTFDDVVTSGSTKECGIDNLKERLDYFFTRYLASLKLAPVPLLDEIEWISYMKLDPTNYLKVQTLVDRTLELFPFIQYAVFLYNDRLLLHNLSKANLPCLYRYLVLNLLPISLRSELQPEYGVKMDQASSSSFYSHGKFITGPASPNVDVGPSKSGSSVKLPSVFLLRNAECQDQNSGSTRLEEYYLIVYRALNATLAMLVPVNDASLLDADLFRNLDEAIGLQLTNLASSFVDLYGKEREASNVTSHHYIYYNSDNLALLTTLNERPPWDGRQFASGSQGFPMELAGVLCEFRKRIIESDYFGDIVAKAKGDYWIAAKKAGDRELYIIAYQKNAKMTDVRDEINRFCASVFDGVFLLE